MMFITDMSSTTVTSDVAGQTIFWALGSMEQHGPHLPLSVDTDIARSLVEAAAARYHGVVAPPLPFGARSLPQSGGGQLWPGTVFIPGDTLISVYRALIAGMANLGGDRLVVVNGHYENEPFLFEAIDACRESGQLGSTKVTAFSWWSLVTNAWLDCNLKGTFPGWHAEHAGLTETSLMLYLKPDVVRPVRPVHETPPRAGIHLHPFDPKSATDGVLSSTSGASSDIGRDLFEHVLEQIGTVL